MAKIKSITGRTITVEGPDDEGDFEIVSYFHNPVPGASNAHCIILSSKQAKRLRKALR